MTIAISHEQYKEKITTFRELARVAVKSKAYGTMTEDEATNLMLSAADLGVSPYKALNGGFHIVKGKLIMAGHLISDRIRSKGHSIKITEQTRDKCVLIGIRKDNGDSCKVEFDLQDAKIAGLLDRDTWKKYPKDMLYNRAISRLGRVLFSDVVGACYSEDEKEDIIGTKLLEEPTINAEFSSLPEVAMPEVRYITDEQMDEIDDLIAALAEKREETFPETEKKFLAWCKVDCIEKIDFLKFDKSIETLKRMLGA